MMDANSERNQLNPDYAEDKMRAIDENTNLPERDGDFPPPDLFHAADALARALSAQSSGVEEASALNLSLDEPALWGMLDVQRAASLMQEKYPQQWETIQQLFPWLGDAAESAQSDAVGAMASQF